MQPHGGRGHAGGYNASIESKIRNINVNWFSLVMSLDVVLKLKKTLLYIYENHLFNFYKYHYITNVSVLIMQNLLDILKSLIWLLFWKTKWLLIDNFCEGRIYVPFFLIVKKSTYPILERQSPEILPSIVKQRPKLNRFSESFWSES